MNCKETKEVLHGYLDGELELAHNLAVEQHLQECAACARSYREQQSLRKVMAGRSLYFEAPKGLEKSIRSAVSQASKAESPRWQWRRFWDWPRVLAPLAAAAVVLLIALPLVMHNSTEDRLAQEIVSAHVRSLMASHLTDVASSDQHTVKPWFNGKLPFSPLTVDLEAQGFPLIGGRLDYVEDHPVAALVYQHRKHFINLFTWPSTRVSGTAEEFRTQRGYNAIHWRQDGMEYWAVSDMNRGDLGSFVRLVRGGAPPPSPP
ncbi:MAG TPA: anti-sigma factor [Candidatus Binatia bacterium]|jgi:anti-sigma factor RsiW|nr:anti-sigma factor [Candidatus Binatia bacterium]